MFWHFFGDTVVAAVGKVSGASRGASLPQRIATHTPYPPALLFSWYIHGTYMVHSSSYMVQSRANTHTPYPPALLFSLSRYMVHRGIV